MKPCAFKLYGSTEFNSCTAPHLGEQRRGGALVAIFDDVERLAHRVRIVAVREVRF